MRRRRSADLADHPALDARRHHAVGVKQARRAGPRDRFIPIE
jgi:hypothetical protein